MHPFLYVILVISWVLWFAPFVITRWHFGPTAQSDKRARWGMLLQMIAYTLLWQTRFWTRSPGPIRVAISMILLALAPLLSWTATRALGKHLRLDAAVAADHELVRSGPYRFIRHPIYTSMLCILLGTGALITPLALLVIAVIVCIAGTEIRVRVEDRLLSTHFGDAFRDYKRSASAYVPLVR